MQTNMIRTTTFNLNVVLRVRVTLAPNKLVYKNDFECEV